MGQKTRRSYSWQPLRVAAEKGILCPNTTGLAAPLHLNAFEAATKEFRRAHPHGKDWPGHFVASLRASALPRLGEGLSHAAVCSQAQRENATPLRRMPSLVSRSTHTHGSGEKLSQCEIPRRRHLNDKLAAHMVSGLGQKAQQLRAFRAPPFLTMAKGPKRQRLSGCLPARRSGALAFASAHCPPDLAARQGA